MALIYIGRKSTQNRSFIICTGHKEKVSFVQPCSDCYPSGLQPASSLCPRHVPGKNTGVGCHFLPQRIFLCLWRWQVDALPLSHQGSPRKNTCRVLIKDATSEGSPYWGESEMHCHQNVCSGQLVFLEETRNDYKRMTLLDTWYFILPRLKSSCRK